MLPRSSLFSVIKYFYSSIFFHIREVWNRRSSTSYNHPAAWLFVPGVGLKGKNHTKLSFLISAKQITRTWSTCGGVLDLAGDESVKFTWTGSLITTQTIWFTSATEFASMTALFWSLKETCSPILNSCFYMAWRRSSYFTTVKSLLCNPCDNKNSCIGLLSPVNSRSVSMEALNRLILDSRAGVLLLDNIDPRATIKCFFSLYSDALLSEFNSNVIHRSYERDLNISVLTSNNHVRIKWNHGEHILGHTLLSIHSYFYLKVKFRASRVLPNVMSNIRQFKMLQFSRDNSQNLKEKTLSKCWGFSNLFEIDRSALQRLTMSS